MKQSKERWIIPFDLYVGLSLQSRGSHWTPVLLNVQWLKKKSGGGLFVPYFESNDGWTGNLSRALSIKYFNKHVDFKYFMCGTTDKKWNNFLNIKGLVSIWTVRIHCLPRHTARAMAPLAAFKPERYRNTCSAVMIVRAVIHHGTREICLNENLLSPLSHPDAPPPLLFHPALLSPSLLLYHWGEYWRITLRRISKGQKKGGGKHHWRVWDVAKWKSNVSAGVGFISCSTTSMLFCREETLQKIRCSIDSLW